MRFLPQRTQRFWGKRRRRIFALGTWERGKEGKGLYFTWLPPCFFSFFPFRVVLKPARTREGSSKHARRRGKYVMHRTRTQEKGIKMRIPLAKTQLGLLSTFFAMYTESKWFVRASLSIYPSSEMWPQNTHLLHQVSSRRGLSCSLENFGRLFFLPRSGVSNPNSTTPQGRRR